MEVEAMLEDDVFFAELSKRISLLITDDDDGADFAAAAQFIPAAAPLPGFTSLAHVQPRQQQGGGASSLLAPPPYTLYHHGASYGGDSAARAVAAAWQQQQCGSKGTGVFIPRSTPGAAHPKKKGKNRGSAAAKAARAGAANALAAGAPAKKRV
ncbi:hypothetical protein SEVIR_3G258200v4 [Setaria viridis]|uniref:Uncharacterized protein n=2 Tax=Setaria TaxID=4554 RepID=A0A368QIR1_SETIT|nr:uncharacterized protein LOC101775776 [Setaria italica]XP_034588533.1 uncharacterized protein LOC117850776 [Setaria viridis]RCV17839.1 hypothetical protein SETIT_3G251900v2 [Setaria italica]TKW27457.1 hypothetical protein SEVIR_3G258200v2 [Setaria viridis]